MCCPDFSWNFLLFFNSLQTQTAAHKQQISYRLVSSARAELFCLLCLQLQDEVDELAERMEKSNSALQLDWSRWRNTMRADLKAAFVSSAEKNVEYYEKVTTTVWEDVNNTPSFHWSVFSRCWNPVKHAVLDGWPLKHSCIVLLLKWSEVKLEKSKPLRLKLQSESFILHAACHPAGGSSTTALRHWFREAQSADVATVQNKSVHKTQTFSKLLEFRWPTCFKWIYVRLKQTDVDDVHQKSWLLNLRFHLLEMCCCSAMDLVQFSVWSLLMLKSWSSPTKTEVLNLTETLKLNEILKCGSTCIHEDNKTGIKTLSVIWEMEGRLRVNIIVDCLMLPVSVVRWRSASDCHYTGRM